jgi:hypothetical protein
MPPAGLCAGAFFILIGPDGHPADMALAGANGKKRAE